MDTPQKDSPMLAIDPAEVAAQRQQQRAMIRKALGDQYALWLKLQQERSTNVKKNDS